MRVGNNINIFALCIAIWTCISCEQSGVDRNSKIFEEMARSEEGVPLLYGNVLTFVSSLNAEDKIMINLNQLQMVYNKLFGAEYDSFDSFLKVALSQKMKFDINDFGKGEAHRFILSERIKEECSNNTLDFLKEKYLQVEGQNIFILKKGIDDTNELYSILYFFFINGYKVGFDDYLGNYSVGKW